MIPLATTTIAILRPTEQDLDAEPYSGGEQDRLVETATGVRAVIDRPSGREQIAGGEQDIWDFELVSDLADLGRNDSVKDEATGVVYRVVWIWVAPGEHIEAGLRIVQGEV